MRTFEIKHTQLACGYTRTRGRRVRNQGIGCTPDPGMFFSFAIILVGCMLQVRANAGIPLLGFPSTKGQNLFLQYERQYLLNFMIFPFFVEFSVDITHALLADRRIEADERGGQECGRCGKCDPSLQIWL